MKRKNFITPEGVTYDALQKMSTVKDGGLETTSKQRTFSMKTFLYKYFEDTASDTQKVRLRGFSLCGIALLAILALSSCMFVPNEGVKEDKTKPVLFMGGVAYDKEKITIEAYNPQKKSWHYIGDATSGGKLWTWNEYSAYAWITRSAIPSEYWAKSQKCATVGDSALVRSKGAISGDLVSFRDGVVDCMFDNPSTFLSDCKAPQSPAVRVGGLDFRDFGKECAAKINVIRAKEGKPLLTRYEAGECAADDDSKVNYQWNLTHPQEFHKSQSGSAQNTCPSYSTIDDILNNCIWQQEYLDEKKCYQQNPGGCYGNSSCECGHYVNMVMDPDQHKVACGLYETPTGWWATQNFYH